MLSSSKILMAAKPRYQMGSDITQAGVNGRFCMSADGRVVAVSVFDVSNKVVVRRWTGSAWEQMGSEIAVVEQGDGDPGVGVERVSLSLDASGTTLAVGAPTGLGTVNGQSFGLGRVYVYEWNGSSWDAKGDVILNPTADSPIDASGNPGLGFGGDVSLSRFGTRLAVGAFEKYGGVTAAGNPFVAIYDWDRPTGEENGSALPGSWVLERTILGSGFVQEDWDTFGGMFSDMTGRSVSLSSDGGVVAYGVLDSSGVGRGTVSTLNCQTCGPDSIALIYEPGPLSSSRTDNPISVSLSGDGGTVAISDEGYVHELDMAMLPRTTVYRNNGQSWEELGSENILLGRTRLSHDGNVAATSEGLLYRWDGSSWTQLGGKMVPIGFFGDCALSSDGTVVAVGDDVDGSYVCRVFRWN